MSMIGVSVASSKSLQLEATQEAYDRAVVKLNLLSIEDKTHEELYDVIINDERFLDEDNLITLCKDCHLFGVHGYKKSISNEAQ